MPNPPAIKFSHRYPKLLDERNEVIQAATLLQVRVIRLEDQHQAFLDYDTDSGRYPLPAKGEFIQLLFLKPPNGEGAGAANLFTTLRRRAHNKLAYYQSQVGKEFKIEIVEG